MSAKVLLILVSVLTVTGIGAILVLNKTSQPSGHRQQPTAKITNPLPKKESVGENEKKEETTAVDNVPAAPVSWRTIRERNGLFTVEIPTEWTYEFGAARGVRLAELNAQSPDFDLRIDDTIEGPHSLLYYNEGAMLTIVVFEGDTSAGDRPIGATEGINIEVAGVPAHDFIFREPSTAQGILQEARFAYNGRSYVVRMGYNPETFSLGDSTYRVILSSFRFE